SIGLCWAFLAGEWLAEQQPIVIKKHGRKAKSIFRYGFDYLRRVLLNIEQHQPQFQQALQLLSGT
ncbi:MAG: IS4 family transposase, partial [Pegethrix bostrychoides GSE-TBD4-15B]|nr:IS4 family transposase [Pegethrix bostrychoides GSE-TBD4-15B]MBW4467447.1 IS4 family transposase [Pegethrix bostrychoides GSE-TBD4-15B]